MLGSHGPYRPAAPLLLAALLLLAQPTGSAALDVGGAISNAAQTVKGVFGGGESSGGGGGGGSQGSPASFGPIVAKTTRAAAALAGLGGSNATAHQLPLGDAANVTLIKDPSRPHSLVLAFEAAPSLAADGASDTVPFLDRFAATAEAPAALLEAFMQAVEGPGTQGTLAEVWGTGREGACCRQRGTTPSSACWPAKRRSKPGNPAPLAVTLLAAVASLLYSSCRRPQLNWRAQMPCCTCCALALVLAAAAWRCCAGPGLPCRWGLHAVGGGDALLSNVPRQAPLAC